VGDTLHDLDRVAHHEAGHAVIARVLGIEFLEIALEGEEDAPGQPGTDYNWSGKVPYAPEPDPEKASKGCLAGSLAEIKFVGAQESVNSADRLHEVLPSVTIDAASLPELEQTLLSVLKRDKAKMEARVKLIVSGTESEHRVFLGESENDLSTAKKVLPEFERMIGQLLRETKALVDDRRVWNAIVTLADRLVRQRCVVRKVKSLGRANAYSLIDEALGTGAERSATS
jgi:hypothetical protein